MTTDPAMNIDDVIRDFAQAGSDLPRASMQWALENWDVAAPRFIELLDRCARGADRTESTKSALFFIIHLLGEMRETEAFEPLCRLLEDAENSESVLGDGITENLGGVLINSYNGDSGTLKKVIESTTADEFTRAEALGALAYLTRAGRMTDDEMRAYLMRLRAEMQPQEPCFIWSAWALSAANLGYRDYAGEVEELIRLGFISTTIMNLEDFKVQLRRTLDDPEGMAGFEYDRVKPFTDTIGTLSTWYGFSEQFKLDQARLAARQEEEPEPLLFGDPYVNPFRHVGRNDPCPCGSGKKYKKCCLQ